MSTTKTIGTQSFVQMLAATMKTEYARFDKLKAVGGFTVDDLKKETGLTKGQCERKLSTMKLLSELAVSPENQRTVRVYLPAGVKLPK
jgi:hypothetical protein